MPETARKPTDAINADVDSYCWHPDGWEAAGEWSVQDARNKTRGQAAALFARDDWYGDITAVRVWKRYVRPLTRQDVWSDYGADRWLYRHMDKHHLELKWQEDRKGEPDEWIYVDADTGARAPEPQPPAEAPADWEPDPEGDPVWEFVHRSHPDAIPVWVCGDKDADPPSNPRAASRDSQETTS